MNEEQFQDFITKRRVEIVHFSHFAVMDHKVPFPEDIQHALGTWPIETRSCCAIWPGHKMILPGSVGVIFRPALSNVLSVLAEDSGASDHGGQENSAGHPTSETALINSLNVPIGCYNEWRLNGAKPHGIFVADTNHIRVKQWQKIEVPEEAAWMGDEFELGAKSVDFSCVANAFPDHDIYTMGDEGIELLHKRVVV